MMRKANIFGLAIGLLFIMVPSVGSLPVPDTGQSECYPYDVNGDSWNEAPCPAAGEAYYGDFIHQTRCTKS